MYIHGGGCKGTARQAEKDMLQWTEPVHAFVADQAETQVKPNDCL